MTTAFSSASNVARLMRYACLFPWWGKEIASSVPLLIHLLHVVSSTLKACAISCTVKRSDVTVAFWVILVTLLPDTTARDTKDMLTSYALKSTMHPDQCQAFRYSSGAHDKLNYLPLLSFQIDDPLSKSAVTHIPFSFCAIPLSFISSTVRQRRVRSTWSPVRCLSNEWALLKTRLQTVHSDLAIELTFLFVSVSIWLCSVR